MSNLTFNELSQANRVRCATAYHPIFLWSPTDWATAAAGELGEALNKIKKSRRTNYQNLHAERQEIGYELADTIIYIDLLAARLGLELEPLIREKFNIVSDRVGSEIKL